MTHSRRLWWLVLLGGVLVACAEEAAEEPPPAPPPVHVDAVRREAQVPHTTGTAELEPLRRATLSVEAPGRVTSVAMERGQAIEAGDVLLRLDVGRTAVAAQAAAAGVTQAEAQLAQVERERALAERLHRSGSVSQQSLDQARDAERVAHAAVRASQAQVRLSRRGLTEAVLRAPFSGTLVERRAEVGEFVSPGAPVAILMDVSELHAEVLLDPRDALDIQPGAHVAAHVFARPDEVFEGRVLRIGEAIDPMTRRLPVEVQIDDPAHRLRPGLVARFEVQTGPARDRLTVDADAVFERFEVHQVYAIDPDGVAHRREVSLGDTVAGRTVVLEGLEAGDRVVVDGQDRVLDGEPVTLVERTPENPESEG